MLFCSVIYRATNRKTLSGGIIMNHIFAFIEESYSHNQQNKSILIDS